jgi:hypothetical protein
MGALEVWHHQNPQFVQEKLQMFFAKTKLADTFAFTHITNKWRGQIPLDGGVLEALIDGQTCPMLRGATGFRLDFETFLLLLSLCLIVEEARRKL